jgi:hypothetical protein
MVDQEFKIWNSAFLGPSSSQSPNASLLDEHLVLRRPFGRTAGQQHQGNGAIVRDLVTRPGRDNYRVARVHLCFLVVDFHQAGTGQDMIELLGYLVEVLGHALAGCDSGFGQALLSGGGISTGRQLPNNRLVRCYKNGD